MIDKPKIKNCVSETKYLKNKRLETEYTQMVCEYTQMGRVSECVCVCVRERERERETETETETETDRQTDRETEREKEHTLNTRTVQWKFLEIRSGKKELKTFFSALQQVA